MSEPVAMDVDATTTSTKEVAAMNLEEDVEEEEEEEEDIEDLLELVDDASSKPAAQQVPILISVIKDETGNRYGTKAGTVKERAIYDLTRAYCATKQYDEVVNFLTGSTGKQFFEHSTKAKCAKVVRQVLDIVCTLAPEQLDMQEQICNNIIDWCRTQKRTFLRQRVEAKLASILFQQKDYGTAISLIDRLLKELKKLDDKQLLVETHLMESRVHFALRNVPKAKAALTASRTAANAIYVSPSLQASIDTMSGTIHTQEGDYSTAHSYFLEAFEQLDQMNNREQAVPCLKYMMLCRILDSLNKALKLSAKGGVGTFSLAVMKSCAVGVMSW